MAKNSTRSRREAKGRQKQQQRMIWIGAGGIAAVMVIGILLITAARSRASVAFPDIHGMSFTGDGEQLRIATHTGIAVYQDGNWSKPDLPINDYMGYSGTEDGFFSSGHPGAGSRLVNPIGLVRSQDNGANVAIVNFLGETDFHVMGASYYGDTVYVLNPTPNSLLSTGLHYSLDGGETWQQSAASGLPAAPIQIAVHPSEPGVIALATQSGLFLSNDFGATFTQVGDAAIVTSVAFDTDGERLLFGFNRLFSYALSDGQIVAVPTTPDVNPDQAILYITVNPLDEEMAFATSNRDIFYSPDNGQSWNQIGKDGTSS